MNWKKQVFHTILTTSLVYAKAQDPHFSQYFAAPLTINPALAGKFDGDFRANANFRNQWSNIDNGYKTFTGSVDMPILKNRIDDRDRLAVGVSGYTDKSARGAVNLNYFSITSAFHKGLDTEGWQQIGLGLQATYADMVINTSRLRFADQITPYGFTNLSEENFNNTLKNHYFDVNAGLLYTYSTSEDNNYYIGTSMYHINRPKQNFTIGDFQIAPRYTFHGGGYFPAGDQKYLHLSALHSRQSGTNETLIGGALQFQISDPYNTLTNTNFFAGGWIRLNDAVIPYIGLEYYNVRLGITYDINTSNTKTVVQGRNGLELSLQYVFKKDPEKSAYIRKPNPWY
ncbi:MAG: PorP/SprF family type IX secretion system membrane protein [Chitinophagaceae bacterium]